MYSEIPFSYNWNNKLECMAFTTLRLLNKNKYVVGRTYNISLNGEHKFKAQIVDIKNIRLNQINAYIAYLDTGYSASECENIIRKMYSKNKINWNTQLISFILLVKIKPAKSK